MAVGNSGASGRRPQSASVIEGSVVEAYRRALAARGFVEDAAQREAIDCLQRLASRCEAFERDTRSLMGRWIRRPRPPRGLWLWGGVGRGKSFL
ncbi:MAG: hypothetical protein RL322_1299, partial [Pseudomonadota bacterium]